MSSEWITSLQGSAFFRFFTFYTRGNTRRVHKPESPSSRIPEFECRAAPASSRSAPDNASTTSSERDGVQCNRKVDISSTTACIRSPLGQYHTPASDHKSLSAAHTRTAHTRTAHTRAARTWPRTRAARTRAARTRAARIRAARTRAARTRAGARAARTRARTQAARTRAARTRGLHGKLSFRVANEAIVVVAFLH